MSNYLSLAMGSAVGAAAFIWMLVRINRYNQGHPNKQLKLPLVEAQSKDSPHREHELVGHM